MSDAHEAAVRHFHSLSSQQQAEAICRLAAAGWLPGDIAALTQLSVEAIERLLGSGDPLEVSPSGEPLEVSPGGDPLEVAR